MFLCIKLERKKRKKKEKMLNVFVHTEYKTVTSSSTATMANVQFNVLVIIMSLTYWGPPSSSHVFN